MSTRLVRRAPLTERIKNYLDPWDWWFWALEELNSNDWEDFTKSYATSIGLGLNFVYVIAKANSGFTSRDDVFADEKKSGSFGVWASTFFGLIVTVLTALSFANAFYTFYRKRHYRLYQQPIETTPTTPSAQRVRVDSSPGASTPLRYLQSVIGAESAASRAHPDASRDVWEIAMWDPNPLCLQLFCLFSPLHVVLYWLNLPVAPLESRPSVKVFTTLVIAALLSAQFYWLRSSFSQQIKDSAIIHREVLNEYDTKFVHPNLQRPYRDVGIQTIPNKKKYRESGGSELASEVDTYTPTTIIKRGFRTNPNEAYASQYDPDNLASQSYSRPARSNNHTPSLRPQAAPRYVQASTGTTGADFSPLVKQPPVNIRERSQFRPSHVGSGDGGSLGVYSHAASPLRKSASTNYLRDERSRDGERRAVSPSKRDGSPLKRVSTPSGFTSAEARTAAMPNPFQTKGYSNLGTGRRESGRF